MKDERFPWTQVGPGSEPQLPSDFASRVIDRARTTRARKRRAKFELGAVAGLAVVLATFLWLRTTPPNQQTIAQGSSQALADLDASSWSYEADPDVVSVLMPSAQPAEKFDAYYGTATWDTYASWDSASYDASRTR
jgi:hypothetical protein